jgi:putative redox protein
MEDSLVQEPPAGKATGETAVIDETGLGRFQVTARVGPSAFLVDEPVMVGGLGSGPNPYDLLGSALGSCTLMTVRLYADHKKWPLERVRVRVTRRRTELQTRDVFATEILLEGPLDDTQRARLIEIAGHCPVHRTLERGVDFATTLLPSDHAADDPPSNACDHVQNMKEVCGMTPA